MGPTTIRVKHVSDHLTMKLCTFSASILLLRTEYSVVCALGIVLWILSRVVVHPDFRGPEAHDLQASLTKCHTDVAEVWRPVAQGY